MVEPFWLAHVMVRVQKTEMKIMMNIMSKMMMEFMKNVSKMKKIIITKAMINHTQKQLVSMAHHYNRHVMAFNISILLI
jgi:hypothetical protein